MQFKIIAIAFILFLMTNSQADDREQFVSKSAQTVMIELYSSQGCSSCPPAERWISQFVDDDSLWRDYVPIVFHVDYWNDLGWIDVFSNAENSKRQRAYYAQKKIKSVYTPGLIINGKRVEGRRLLYKCTTPWSFECNVK